MASSIDTANRKSGSSEAEITQNYETALQQGEKTAFRAYKVSLNNDQYNPARLANAIQQKLAED